MDCSPVTGRPVKPPGNRNY
jgi:hypothetical protein